MEKAVDRMIKFENKDFIVEFLPCLEVNVSDKNTGEKFKGMGAFAVQFKNICSQQDVHEQLPIAVKMAFRYKLVEEEQNIILGKENVKEKFYGCCGSKGSASCYIMNDNTIRVLCINNKQEVSAITFESIDAGKVFADKFSGCEHY